MTGWLVYERANVARNQFFIDRWLEGAQRRGIALTLLYGDTLAFGIREGLPFARLDGQEGRPDFVVMRLQHPVLSEHLEKMGIAVYNTARVAGICNDKWATYNLFSQVLPMMDTAWANQDTAICPFPYPVVVKANHGCGGRGVFCARNADDFRRALAAIAPDSAVVQPLCDTPGQDVRVYVLGQEIVATMLRHSDQDFRSNVGLGGGFQPYALNSELEGYVRLVMAQFSFGLVGIDFIFHQGRLVFNEIEDAVGTRMLYAHTQRDIAADYLDWIAADLRAGT